MKLSLTVGLESVAVETILLPTPTAPAGVKVTVLEPAVKSASVYLGARFAGERPLAARNLAAALNCRGGPGIVLASLAYDAGIVNGAFYGMLVLLAVITSIAAGSWLESVVRGGGPLR